MLRKASRLLGLAALLAAVCALGTGTALAGPIGMVCTSKPSTSPVFNLVATGGYMESPDGNSSFMWSYANADTGGDFQLPGPVLCVNQGDQVTINLHNGLPSPGAENVSIVFPGQTGVAGSGAAGLFTAEAPPGGDATYTFTASQPGTYLYESGSDPQKQVEMGLYGAIVVRPAGHPNWAYADSSTQFDPNREYILIFSEIDPELHTLVERTNGAAYDINALHNRYFTINGRDFPDTIQDNGVPWLPHQPYGSLVRLQPYSALTNPLPALVRMVNAGELNHPFHPHGNHLRLIARDGRRLLTPAGGDASSEHFGETLPSGASWDFLISWKPNPGDPSSPQSPFPVTIPTYRDLTFKDGNTFYSGSPYLGYKGTLPSTVVSHNVCGELYFPWHSHALNEFTNFDEGFGGMATLLRVDPLGGCFAFPTSTKILSGTLMGGSYSSLAVADASYYQVNSTTTACPAIPPSIPSATQSCTAWYAGLSGVPAGATNLKVTYTGKSSISTPPLPNQTLYVWKWSTSAWVALAGPTSVGTSDVTVTASPPGSPSQYIGTGSYAGQVRVLVRTVRSSGTTQFFTSGNLMKLVYDAP